MKTNKNEPYLVTEDSIEYKGNANHFMGIEGVGGKLLLTSDELVFKSHRFNVQNHIYKIKVKEIKEMKCSFFPPNAFEFFG